MTNDEIREAVENLKQCIVANYKDTPVKFTTVDSRDIHALLTLAEEYLAMKEKSKVSGEAIKEVISGSNLAFYAENKEWVDELYDALLELINGKEKE